MIFKANCLHCSKQVLAWKRLYICLWRSQCIFRYFVRKLCCKTKDKIHDSCSETRLFMFCFNVCFCEQIWSFFVFPIIPVSVQWWMSKINIVGTYCFVSLHQDGNCNSYFLWKMYRTTPRLSQMISTNNLRSRDSFNQVVCSSTCKSVKML